MKTADQIQEELTKRIAVLQAAKKLLLDAGITPEISIEDKVETYNSLLKFAKS